MTIAAPLVPLFVTVVALVGLVGGSRLTVERLLALSNHYDVPEALVGLFVLALGTSLPEIGTHVTASLGILAGTLDYGVTSATVLGGNMGSSTTQQLLLVGLFLVSVGRVSVADDFVRTGVVPMLGAFALTLAVARDGTVSRLDGGLLLVAFGGYAAYSFTRRARSEVLPEARSASVGRDALLALAGLVTVLVSAFVVLASVEVLVAGLRLGGSIVGLLTIGIAASLPELSTVLESVRRSTPNLALGTLIGSNVVNPLVGVGGGGVISTYAVPAPLVLWDLPFKIACGLGFLAVLVHGDRYQLDRREGVVLVLLYLAYVVGRLLLFPGQ